MHFFELANELRILNNLQYMVFSPIRGRFFCSTSETFTLQLVSCKKYKLSGNNFRHYTSLIELIEHPGRFLTVPQTLAMSDSLSFLRDSTHSSYSS